MNKKYAPIIVLIVLLFAIWVFKDTSILNSSSTEELNRTPQRIIYTKHARCRMDCRHFTESEVREILESGKVNKRKSQLNDKPCPSFALEGTTSDGQRARMVFASCDYDEVKVITCIDLNTDYKCKCY